MIGTVILAGLLSALFWAVITGRLRLPPERPQHFAAVDFGPEGGAIVVAHVEDGTLYVDKVRHVRVFRRPPFDWSQHPDL
jgi:hypothetical protein